MGALLGGKLENFCAKSEDSWRLLYFDVDYSLTIIVCLWTLLWTLLQTAILELDDERTLQKQSLK